MVLNLVAFATIIPQAACAGSSLDNGKALYEQKQFARAAGAFAEIVKNEPRNAMAYLYEANCFYALGRYTDAAAWYRAVLKNFPGSSYCSTANSYLAKIEPASATASSSPSDTVPVVASTSSASSAGNKPPSLRGSFDDDKFDIMSMVVLVKPLGQHPKCTTEFVDRVKTTLKQMPRNVVAYCAEKGAKIYITPTLIDYNPELLNTHPRGYEYGFTYKNCPAMYDGRGVVVCQYALRGEDGQEWEATDDPIGALRHEFGHCLDHHLGMLSRTQEYTHIFYLDRGKMDADARSQLSYYVQDGELTGGPSESFAQACCIIFGGSTSKGRMKRDEVFAPNFAGIISFVKGKLAAVHT